MTELARGTTALHRHRRADARDDGGRERLLAALGRLEGRGLIEFEGERPDSFAADGESASSASLARLTVAGSTLHAELTEARCEALTELAADWEPEGDEVDRMIAELGGREPVATA